MRYRVRRADPSGNITLFVLDPVAREERAALAARLMRTVVPDAEQVAFVCPPERGGDGRFEMMGGEFCGNATRAYGMLLAAERGLTDAMRFRIEASGCERPVDVDVDPAAGTARARMPLPRSFRRCRAGGADGVLVDLGGIAHFVTERAPDEAVLRAAEPLILAPRERGGCAGVEAYGVIFLWDGRLTPLVRVPAADTLVWEGSCGSGTLAAAVAQGLCPAGAPEDGAFARDYVQPAGTIRAELAWRGRTVTEAYIGGGVTLGETLCAEL